MVILTALAVAMLLNGFDLGVEILFVALATRGDGTRYLSAANFLPNSSSSAPAGIGSSRFRSRAPPKAMGMAASPSVESGCRTSSPVKSAMEWCQQPIRLSPDLIGACASDFAFALVNSDSHDASHSQRNRARCGW
jgi:hypothetical protein